MATALAAPWPVLRVSATLGDYRRGAYASGALASRSREGPTIADLAEERRVAPRRLLAAPLREDPTWTELRQMLGGAAERPPRAILVDGPPGQAQPALQPFCPDG